MRNQPPDLTWSYFLVSCNFKSPIIVAWEEVSVIQRKRLLIVGSIKSKFILATHIFKHAKCLLTFWIVWACVTIEFQNASFKFMWFCYIFTSFARKTCMGFSCWYANFYSKQRYLLNLSEFYLIKKSDEDPFKPESIFEELISKTSYSHSYMLLICSLRSQQKSQFSTQNLLQMENVDRPTNWNLE